MVAHAHVEHFRLSGTTNMENYRSRGKHAEVKWNIGLGSIAVFRELLVVGRHVLWQIALCGHSRRFFFDQSVLEGAQAFPHATLLRFEEGSITKNENLTVWSTNAGPVPVADILQSICRNLMAHGVFELKHQVDVHPDKYGTKRKYWLMAGPGRRLIEQVQEELYQQLSAFCEHPSRSFASCIASRVFVSTRGAAKLTEDNRLSAE